MKELSFDALTPEFRLVVACCLWPPGEFRSRRIREALQASCDWVLFLKVIKRHRVQGLVLDGLLSHADPVPHSIIEKLKLSAANRATGSLALAGETFRLTRFLKAINIPVACLKGATLSMLAFGDLGLRHSRDIDLIVDPQNALAADSLLQSMGYVMTMPKGPHSEVQKNTWMQLRKHFEYAHSGSGVQLELHWRLFDNSLFFAAELALSSCVQVPVSTGIAIPTLCRRDLLLYLCVHGANHMWFRLRWITDIGALLSQNDEGDIPRLLEDAAREDCVRSVHQALLLSQCLFGVPAVAYPIPADKTTQRLVQSALKTMTLGEGAVELEQIPFATSRVAIARFSLKRDWRFWVREMRLGSVDELDRHHAGVPQSLTFLLPFLRIPLWLTRRLLHGGRSHR